MFVVWVSFRAKDASSSPSISSMRTMPTNYRNLYQLFLRLNQTSPCHNVTLFGSHLVCLFLGVTERSVQPRETHGSNKI